MRAVNNNSIKILTFKLLIIGTLVSPSLLRLTEIDFYKSKWTAAIPAFFSLLRRRCSVISKDSNDVKFFLFSNRNRFEVAEEILFENQVSLSSSNFDRAKATIFIIHGFLSNYTVASGVKRIKDAYLAKGYPANIIMVDHEALTSPDLPYSILSLPFYFRSTSNVPMIGRKVAQFIVFLLKYNAISTPENVHIIGQSIGAHIAGVAGLEVMKRTGKRIQRITGLDPAGPLYHLQKHPKLLDKTDARFVDVTHTNQWIYGVIGSMGHVDFYMNGGGPFQPSSSSICKRVPGSDSNQAAYCSHIAAVIYFAESIIYPNYMACKCRKCRRPPKIGCKEPIIYGQYVPKRAYGDYYVNFKLRMPTPTHRFVTGL